MSELLDEQNIHTAENDTANDELYMGENIGPIVTGDSEDSPEGILVNGSSWSVTADALPDETAMNNDISDDTHPVSTIDQSPMAMPQNNNPASTAIASRWHSDDYMETIHKVASDSDIYYQGYGDATSGKEMDEGLANLSMDYYQGYKQGILYNQTNLESAPSNQESIDERSHYSLPKSAPYHPNFDPTLIRDGVDPKVANQNFTPEKTFLQHRLNGLNPMNALHATMQKHPNNNTVDVLNDYHSLLTHINGTKELEDSHPGFANYELGLLNDVLEHFSPEKNSSVKKKIVIGE